MADEMNTPNMGQEKKTEDSSFDPKKQAQDMMSDVKGMKNAKPGDFMPGKSQNTPTSLKVIQWLLIISAVFSVIGALSLFGYAPLAGVLALISAAVSLVIVWGVNKRVMWAYWLLIALIIYSVVTVFVSWRGGNVLTLVIDAIMLYYVMQSKKWFEGK